MSTSTIRNVEQQDYVFRATPEPSGFLLTLTGTADARSTAELKVFLDEVHAAAKEAGATEVVVDMTKLAFMNSSCFKLLVSWLNADIDLESAAYKIRFVWDASSYWQRRGLAALQAFSTDLVVY